MAKTVAWDEKGFLLDGKPGFLQSGEFHYFRVPKEDWRERLTLFRQAGGNCVATYIPWGLHEPQEGEFVFGDTPSRDLEGFLQLCAQLELLVICRPGPYQYSELTYDGLPAWLCEGYPEIHARNKEGEAFRVSSVSYLHPVFLAKVQTWFRVVCPILARYMVSRGGPVALVQLDNELMGVHAWYGGPDYHPDTLGIGREDGRLPLFLQKKYQRVTRLNRAWGTQYERFSQVNPQRFPQEKSVFALRRAKDFHDFYYHMAAAYFLWLAKEMRLWGIDCQLVHNAANPGMNSWFKESADALGADFLLGSDHYYNLNQEWAQNNPTPQYAVKVLYSCSMLKSWGYPPTVFELPAGSCSDWPPISATDLECCYRLHLAMGMKGLNYYIFTGGPNPPGYGRFGDSYDYGAPIAADGSLRESYRVLRGFGGRLNADAWLSRSERACDFQIGLVNEYARSKEYAQEAPAGFYDGSKAFSLMTGGVLPTALCASFSPGMIELERPIPAGSEKYPLVVLSAAAMARAVQQRLVDFVRAGGKLMLLPVIPWLDEDFEPCTLLQDFLECGLARQSDSVTCAHIAGVHTVLHDRLWTMEQPPAGALEVGRESHTGACCGWLRKTEGGGAVLWLGLDWLHSKQEHCEMFKNLMKSFGLLNPSVVCDNPNIWASLLCEGKKRRLFLMNLFTAPAQTAVKVLGKNGTYTDLGIQSLGSMQVKLLECDEE